MNLFSRKTLMIVDDNTSALRITTALFREAGYEVIPCSNAQEAVKMLGIVDFDAVLSDVRMPGIGGLELLRAIRQRGWGLPVVLMTGDADPQFEESAIAEGAFDILIKPFYPDAALALVQRAIHTA